MGRSTTTAGKKKNWLLLLQEEIHAGEKTIHPERTDQTLNSQRDAGALFRGEEESRRRVLKHRLEQGNFFPPSLDDWVKHDAQVQPAVPDSPVSTGDFISRHVCFIGHFDFSAAVSTDGHT